MYITKVEIENIACFEHLELDFTNPDGSPRMMTVLLGDNGAGKTTLLRAMCLAMAELEPQIVLVSDRSVYARQQATGLDWFAKVDRQPNFWGRFCNDDYIGEVGYGHPVRRLMAYGTKRQALPDPGVYLQTRDPRTAPVISLFEPYPRLMPFHIWFAGEMDRAALNPEKAASAVWLENCLRSLQSLLGSEVAVGYDERKRELAFSSGGARVSWAQLSDGYQAALTLAGDLLYQLADSEVGAPDPSQLAGIVLIDEVDLFLHPKWQRVVLQRLRDAFPKIQFVVTTHSPVTVLGAKEGEVVVLRREGDKVVADTDLPDVTGWRADQLLVSEFFGLSAAISTETEAELRRYRELGALTVLEPSEREELEALAQKFLGLPYRLPGQLAEDLDSGLREVEWVSREVNGGDARQRREAGLAALKAAAARAGEL